MPSLPDAVAVTVYVLFLALYAVTLFKVDEWLGYSPQ